MSGAGEVPPATFAATPVPCPTCRVSLPYHRHGCSEASPLRRRKATDPPLNALRIWLADYCDQPDDRQLAVSLGELRALLTALERLDRSCEALQKALLWSLIVAPPVDDEFESALAHVIGQMPRESGAT